MLFVDPGGQPETDRPRCRVIGGDATLSQVPLWETLLALLNQPHLKPFE